MKDIDTKRETELLTKFDEIVLELSYIGHTKEDLTARISNVLEKERKV